MTLVEYGDYECPHCGAAHPVVKALKAVMEDALRFVYGHFPLTQIHPHAFLAAQSAECAGAQRKDWAMHDMLFAHQDALEVPDLVQYAMASRLDVERFEQDLASQRFVPKVQQDFRGGVRSGVNGTPTFFINGTRYNGTYDLDSLMAAVASAV